MSEKKILTKEIAEQFIAAEYLMKGRPIAKLSPVDLSQYTSLEEEVAIVLSKSDALHINLVA